MCIEITKINNKQKDSIIQDKFQCMNNDFKIIRIAKNKRSILSFENILST